MIIGINAVNIKSGGGTSHLENILININQEILKVRSGKIIVWCNPNLYHLLKKKKLFENILILRVSDNFYYNILWKLFFLYSELKKFNCDILFSPDAVVLKKFKKVVILFQNLLPFNNYEILRYGISFQAIKLIIMRFIYAISIRNAHGTIYLNKYCKKNIENFLGKAKKSKVISHGVPKEYFLERNKDLINKNKKKCIDIIYVSPIDLYKHQWNVIKAVELLIRENKNIRLHLVGFFSNKEAKNLFFKAFNTANNYKKGTIIYYGFLEKKQIINLFKKMDIFLFASSCESFGITLLEAMASNLPILSSNLSGIPSTAGKNVIYFDPLNYLDIYKKIKKVLATPDLLKKISNTYSKVLSKYNWLQTSKETIDFISHINQSKNLNVKKNYYKYYFQKVKNFINNNIFNLLYLNFSFSIIIIFFILYFFSKDYLSVKFILLATFSSVITQIFSLNVKNISVIDKDISLLISHFKLRLIISSFFVLLYFLFLKNYLFNFQYILLDLSILLFVLTLWLSELQIAVYEISNNKKKIIKLLYVISSLYLFFLSSNFFFSSTILSLVVFLNLYSFINFLFFFNFIHRVIFKKKENNKFINKSLNYRDLMGNLFTFFSSSSLVMATFFIRFILERKLEYSYVENIIFSLSLGSLPGSLVATTFGSSYLNKNKGFPNIFKFFIYAYVLSTFLLICTYNFKFYQTEFLLLLIYSLIGGTIMLGAQIMRILNLGVIYNRNSVFLRDIAYSFAVLILLFFVIYFFQTQIYLLYLLFSILAFLIYSFNYKLDVFKKL